MGLSSIEEVESSAAMGAEAEAAAGPPPPWQASVSVRSLCKFTAKRGDLDRRFTPSATALEGLAGQSAVVARRGSDYRAELPLQASFEGLRVRGRADGFDARGNCLEEIKTVRGPPEAMAENRRQLHWAQLETYGALFCSMRGAAEVHLALVYVDAATQAETVLRQLCGAADLQAAFEARCRAYMAWARQEVAHRAARDAGLAALRFPPGSFRPGQRGLAEAVYRAATRDRCLLAQAPTGIGKTIGVLYPLLRAVPGCRIDKVAYLTCKGTGQITALDALHALRSAVPGGALRVLTLVAKEQACEYPGRACHADACPLARGFYDRLPAARAAAVAGGWMGRDAQRTLALQHGICPYHFGHELLRWADVLVGDVHHAFDPHGQLFGLAQALDWRLALLVDEAHNLVDRARQMHSASLTLAQMRAALAGVPAALQAPLQHLLAACSQAVAGQPTAYAAHDAVPAPIADALQALNAALAAHLQEQPLAQGPLLGFYFDALRLQRVVDRFGPHSVFDIVQGADADGRSAGTVADTDTDANVDATFSVRNVVPAPFLRPRFAACHMAVLFSATLAPQAYQRQLLGLPDDTAWIDVPPAFPAAHLQVRVATAVSTRYPHRAASLDAVVALLARQFAAHPGNYLAFFSSFDYLGQAADRLALRAPALPQWRQPRAADGAARQQFLQRFTAAGQGIGFAVLGGAFAEGVDLPGTRLIGVFIATLGLPPFTPVQQQFQARLDTLFGAGHGYADLVPGMQKVVQAAGRVLRTPEDRGWLWLIDDRYTRPDVVRLLPAWWGVEPAAV